MGNRAQYVLIENGEWELFYNHWGSQDVPRDLFFGPERSIEWVRTTRALEPDDLLDDMWCDGAAAIDLGSRRLVLYGGELNWDVPLRRVWLEYMEYSWPGWDIRWALRGLVDIVDAIDLPANRVMSKEPTELLPVEAEVAEWTNFWITIQEPNSLHYVPCQGAGSQTIGCERGSILSSVEQLPHRDRPDRASLTAFSFPIGGIHINRSKYEMSFWCADPFPARDSVAQRWEDWAVEDWGDDYDTHFGVAGPLGSIASRKERIDEVAALMLRNVKLSPAVADIATELARDDIVASVHPAFFDSFPLELDAEEQLRFVASIREALLQQ